MNRHPRMPRFGDMGILPTFHLSQPTTLTFFTVFPPGTKRKLNTNKILDGVHEACVRTRTCGLANPSNEATQPCANVAESGPYCAKIGASCRQRYDQSIFDNWGRTGFDRARKAFLRRVEAHAGLVKSVHNLMAERNYALAA